MASHVALSLMIAVFPFLIFVVSLTGVAGTDGVSRAIIDLVFDYWPDAIAEPIVNEINAVVATASTRFLTLGIGLTIFFASNGVEAVHVALNRAYEDEAQLWWNFRGMLAPELTYEVALTPDARLLSDLAAPFYRLGARGILIESKQEIAKRLGRSVTPWSTRH